MLSTGLHMLSGLSVIGWTVKVAVFLGGVGLKVSLKFAVPATNSTSLASGISDF